MTAVNYNSAADIRAFLEKNGMGMRKKFGQNFLINPGVRQALVNALDAGSGDDVWEVGAGIGAMTSLLLERGLSVRAFEIDTGFVRCLKEMFAANTGFALVEGDVLKTWRHQPPSPYLLGNLPYNIAATLLAGFIEQGRLFKRMVVTVQREVALRMAAVPGSADYSSFSVLCASVYRVTPLIDIKGASFYPKPKVDSRAVLLERNCRCALPSCFYPLVRLLFSSRRKTIKNNLGSFFASRSMSAKAVPEALEKSSLAGSERAENLSIDDFAALAKVVEDMGLYLIGTESDVNSRKS